MSIHRIRVFVSHSWTYSKHYEKIREWLFDTNWTAGGAQLAFEDYSVPKEHPIHNAPNSLALADEIYAQIAPCHVVVIPTGMYVDHSKWIQKEIDAAVRYAKPILGVNPWGQIRKASVVQAAARDVVGWRSDKVVSGVRNLYCTG